MTHCVLSSEVAQELSELVRLLAHYSQRLSEIALCFNAASVEANSLRTGRTAVNLAVFEVKRALEFSVKKE